MRRNLMAIRTYMLLSLSLLVTGCASMNKQECYSANWQAIGYEDASQGKELIRFSEHRKACAKHNITANLEAYKQGHAQGARTYCTPLRGYNLGKSNQALPSFCPSDLTATMRHSYNLGRDLFLEKQILQGKINSINEESKKYDANIAKLSSELQEHQKYLKLAEDSLKNPNLGTAERLTYYTQGARLKELIKEKKNEIEQLQEKKKPYADSINTLNQQIRALDSRPLPALSTP